MDLAQRDGFHLIVVGPAFQNLEHTVLRQGGHPFAERRLAEFRGAYPHMDELFDLVGDDQ